VLNQVKLIVSWNLPRLAADLAAHLESLERAGNLLNTVGQSEDFLEPYNLSLDDFDTVLGLASNKGCIDCGRLWDNYMVRDDIWLEAGLGPADNCCRECLPLRLERPLGVDDFTWPGPLPVEDSPRRQAAVREWRRRRSGLPDISNKKELERWIMRGLGFEVTGDEHHE
jgi:hypothetical protein